MLNFSSPHVHVQSLDSASTPEAFAKREIELGTGALVITDHGSLAGCQTVYDLARKKKLTPVLGLEGYFRDDDCPLLLGAGHQKNPEGKLVDTFKYGHFTCHFLDHAALKVGVKLLSRAPVEQHGQESKPLFNWAAMEELGGTNTTITTGCLIGMVQRHLLDRADPRLARAYYERLRSIVQPGNFYVETFPHRCTHNWVAGVFVTVQEEGGDPIRLKWYAGKTLRTDAADAIKAEDLAKAWGKPGCKHTQLLAVKDYQTWVDRIRAKILNVEHVEDFIQNECRPYAPDGDVQLGANQFMLELAREHGDPVLVSDDSHYAHPEEKVVQDVRLAQSGSWRFYGSYHRQSSEEAYDYFKTFMGIDQGEFGAWVENSRAWAARFKDFKMEAKPSLPTKFYEIKYAEVGAKNSFEYTMHLIDQHGRMDWANPVWVDRLQCEIELLHRNGIIDLLPYFMTFEEVCRLYRDAGRLTGPGRGSAAGLLLTYLLGITHVDPLRFNLSLDRFLTLDRIKSGKFPDIDQDLDDRDLLVGADGNSGWLRERFGDHVAQISTITTLKLRNAVLDVARYTLGHVPADIAELAHKFEMPPQGLEDIKHVLGYEDSGSWVAGSITYDVALQTYVKAYPSQWEIVQKCLGLGRGRGRHACGYAIANEPLDALGIPLTTIGGVRCTEFTAGAVEAAGVLKKDFLVVTSLLDIGAAIRLVRERSGREIPADGLRLNGRWVPASRLVPLPGDDGWADVWDLPEDQAVFRDVATGDTETVFQLNKPAALQGLRHFSHRRADGTYPIDSIASMAAFTALDRPGPLDAYVRTPGAEECRTCRDGKDIDGSPCRHGKHNMLVEYARRARGAETSQDVFPLFNQLFPETYGVMVYQEQMQKLYQVVTGCPGPEAEEFRSNVAKKKKEKIIEAYPKFIAGATATLGSKEQAEAMWAFLQSWAAYGFNKCVSGDTVVVRAGGNEHSPPEITIRELYEAQQSKTPWGEKIRAGRLNILQMSDDSRLRPGRLKAIHYNGQKPVYLIKLSDGKSIKATSNHRFLTSCGYQYVSVMQVGDEMVVAGREVVDRSMRQTERARGKSYVGCGMPEGEENPAWIDGRTGYLKAAKAEVWVRSGGVCEACGTRPGPGKHDLEFAHTMPLESFSGRYDLYHSPGNARMLCNSCHKLFDYAKGERKRRWSKGVPTTTATIVSKVLVPSEDTYDVEMDTVGHNFVANGVVSHNSHAVCYMFVAYACAWLKHHYPLEWWTAVLRHADKDKINTVLWKHCGHLIDLPDVTQAYPTFTIVDGRIKAPLAMLQGVGPAAAEELIAGAPFTSFGDYVAKIEATKIARTAPGKVKKKVKETNPDTGETVVKVVEVDGIVKGRSALHAGITYKLIVTGAMDKLGPGMSTTDIMVAYEEAVWVYENERRARRLPKPMRPKKAPEGIKEGYENLTQYTRYQMRKEILPAISEDIRPYLEQRQHPRVTRRGQGLVYHWGKRALPLAGGPDIDRVDAAEAIPEDGVRGAVAGYVYEVKKFAYGRPVKDKEALKIIVDLGDSTRREFVCWPDRETGQLDEWAAALVRKGGGLEAGALVVVVLNKYREHKPFTVEFVDVVQPALGSDGDSQGEQETE